MSRDYQRSTQTGRRSSIPRIAGQVLDLHSFRLSALFNHRNGMFWCACLTCDTSKLGNERPGGFAASLNDGIADSITFSYVMLAIFQPRNSFRTLLTRLRSILSLACGKSSCEARTLKYCLATLSIACCFRAVGFAEDEFGVISPYAAEMYQ
jgi:hypothetical protein